MYRKEMWVGLSFGMSTPKIRGICLAPYRPFGFSPGYFLIDGKATESPLPLFVTGVFTDNQKLAVPLNKLALFANPFHT